MKSKLKSNLEVNNLPDYPLQKFTVFKLVNCGLWFWGTWDDEQMAKDVAQELGNAVVVELADEHRG